MIYSSTAADDSAVVSVGNGSVDEVIFTNTAAGVRYLHIFFETAALPANTTDPDICIACPATSTVSWDPRGKVETGKTFVLALSTTADGLTVGVANEGLFYVR